MKARFWQKAIVVALGLGVVVVLGTAFVLQAKIRQSSYGRWLIPSRPETGGTDCTFDTFDGPPPINGTIAAVSPEEKLAVLSVGKNQKVREGYKFTVYRGDQFVGKVQVIEVYEDLAGAKVIYTRENDTVRVGDKAATQI